MPANIAQGKRRRAVRRCQGPNSPISLKTESNSILWVDQKLSKGNMKDGVERPCQGLNSSISVNTASNSMVWSGQYQKTSDFQTICVRWPLMCRHIWQDKPAAQRKQIEDKIVNDLTLWEREGILDLLLKFFMCTAFSDESHGKQNWTEQLALSDNFGEGPWPGTSNPPFCIAASFPDWAASCSSSFSPLCTVEHGTILKFPRWAVFLNSLFPLARK